MNRDVFDALMNQIVKALIERGYNPYAQIQGYLTRNELTYITSYNGARSTMKTLDRSMVWDYLKHWEEYQDEKWRVDFVQSHQ